MFFQSKINLRQFGKNTAFLTVDAEKVYLKDAPNFSRKIRTLLNEIQNQNAMHVRIGHHFEGHEKDLTCAVMTAQEYAKNAKTTNLKKVFNICTPKKDEYVLMKPLRSSFKSTDLNEFLKRKYIDNVVITGAIAKTKYTSPDFCKDKTIKDALSHNFNVIVLEDLVLPNKNLLKETFPEVSFQNWENLYLENLDTKIQNIYSLYEEGDIEHQLKPGVITYC